MIWQDGGGSFFHGTGLPLHLEVRALNIPFYDIFALIPLRFE